MCVYIYIYIYIHTYIHTHEGNTFLRLVALVARFGALIL